MTTKGLGLSNLDTTLCYVIKFVNLWYSQCTSVSSTNKIDRQNITANLFDSGAMHHNPTTTTRFHFRYHAYMTTKGLGLGSAKVEVLPTKYMSKILIDSCVKYCSYIEAGGGKFTYSHMSLVLSFNPFRYGVEHLVTIVALCPLDIKQFVIFFISSNTGALLIMG
jgi:hypothetical protein